MDVDNTDLLHGWEILFEYLNGSIPADSCTTSLEVFSSRDIYILYSVSRILQITKSTVFDRMIRAGKLTDWGDRRMSTTLMELPTDLDLGQAYSVGRLVLKTWQWEWFGNSILKELPEEEIGVLLTSSTDIIRDLVQDYCNEKETK